MQPPDNDHQVFFQIGMSSGESFHMNTIPFSNGHANLEANTRAGLVADTRLYMDLTNSNLAPGEKVKICPIILDADTSGVETEELEIYIVNGNRIGNRFRPTWAIARIDPKFGAPALGAWGVVGFTAGLLLCALFLGRGKRYRYL